MKKFIYEERSIGKLILLIGVLLAVPLLVLPFYPEDAVYIPAFLIPALFSILLGLGIGTGKLQRVSVFLQHDGAGRLGIRHRGRSGALCHCRAADGGTGFI